MRHESTAAQEPATITATWPPPHPQMEALETVVHSAHHPVNVPSARGRSAQMQPSQGAAPRKLEPIMQQELHQSSFRDSIIVGIPTHPPIPERLQRPASQGVDLRQSTRVSSLISDVRVAESTTPGFTSFDHPAIVVEAASGPLPLPSSIGALGSRGHAKALTAAIGNAQPQRLSYQGHVPTQIQTLTSPDLMNSYPQMLQVQPFLTSMAASAVLALIQGEHITTEAASAAEQQNSPPSHVVQSRELTRSQSISILLGKVPEVTMNMNMYVQRPPQGCLRHCPLACSSNVCVFPTTCDGLCEHPPTKPCIQYCARACTNNICTVPYYCEDKCAAPPLHIPPIPLNPPLHPSPFPPQLPSPPLIPPPRCHPPTQVPKFKQPPPPSALPSPPSTHPPPPAKPCLAQCPLTCSHNVCTYATDCPGKCPSLQMPPPPPSPVQPPPSSPPPPSPLQPPLAPPRPRQPPPRPPHRKRPPPPQPPPPDRCATHFLRPPAVAN